MKHWSAGPELKMDGHQSRSGNSRQRQMGVNASSAGSGPMPTPFAPVAPRPEQDNTSYRPWFPSSQAEPCELIFPKNRKSADDADCDGEADLQGLVSNILDETDSQDSFYSESLPTCNPIWSPKTLNEELRQYFQSEAKTPNNSSFPSNHLSHEAFSNVQLQSVNTKDDGLSQQSSGLSGNKQCFFYLPNGANYSLYSQKPPPGLPLPKTLNTKPSHMHQMNDINMSPCSDRGNNQPLNNFSELSIFRHQNDINNSRFDALHGDHYTQSSINSFCNENGAPEDLNQLVSSFQSFMPSEHNGTCHDDFPNVHQQTVSLHKDGLPEQWKITNPAMSTLSFPAMQILKQLFGDVGSVQRGRPEEARKQNHHACQGPPDFSPQHAEYFQKSKALSARFNFPNQHQNKRTFPNESSNLRVNHFGKQQIKQSHIQKNMNSQMEREKTKMQMSGFHGDGFSVRQQSNITVGGKELLSQYPHLNFQGNMQPARPDRENNMSSAGNAQHFIPLMYPLNDPRRYSGMPMSSNFISRPTAPYGNGVSGMTVNEMMLTNEAAAFSSSVSDMKAHRGENTYGMASALATSLMSQEVPAVQLYFYLDDCYEQWRCLEKKRKRMESLLKKNFPGKRTLVTTSTSLPRNPPNPTPVEHLVINLMREQSKVASILDRMKCLCSIPLHISIEMALRNHHVALCITQARCKKGSEKWPKNQQQGVGFTEDRDNLLLITALKDLAATTRRLRTALWCALQMTLQQPVLVQEHHAYEEPTCTERCSSLFQSYSFCL